MKCLHYKQGFSPIEIIFALAIFSILAGVLSQSLMQLNRSLSQVTRISEFDIRATLVQNLLEKELAGAYVPLIEKLPPVDDVDSEKKLPEKKLNEDKKRAKSPQDVTNKKEKKEMLYPPKGFVVQADSSGMVQLLTFITSNPLTVYNMAKPRLARIVYKLRQDEDFPGTFSLLRYEVPNIMDVKVLSDDSAIKGFIVVKGITKFSIECYAAPIAPEEKEQKEEESTEKNKQSEQKLKQEKPEKKEFVKKEEWESPKTPPKKEEKKEAKKSHEKELPPAPDMLKITIEFVINKHAKSLSFMCARNFALDPLVVKGRKPEPPEKKDKKDGVGLKTKVGDKNIHMDLPEPSKALAEKLDSFTMQQMHKQKGGSGQ